MDMAASILFLVSKAGLFYNNQLLHPDGGQILEGSGCDVRWEGSEFRTVV